MYPHICTILCMFVHLKANNINFIFINFSLKYLKLRREEQKMNISQSVTFSFTQNLQCGIILCGLAIISSSWLTKKSCGLLLKTGQVARRRNFEGLGELLPGEISESPVIVVTNTGQFLTICLYLYVFQTVKCNLIGKIILCCSSNCHFILDHS